MRTALATMIVLVTCCFATIASGQEPRSGIGSGKIFSQPKPAQGNSENIDFTLGRHGFDESLTSNTTASYDSRTNKTTLEEHHSAEQPIVPRYLGTEPVDVDRSVFDNSNSTSQLVQFCYSMALESRSYGFAWYTNYDWANFQERLNTLGNQGARIENIDTYGRSVFKYAGTWTQDGKGWAWVLNYSDYNSFLSLLIGWPNGTTRFRPIDFAINPSGTQMLFGAVAVADNLGFGWTLNESNANTFTTWINNQFSANRRIVEIQIYRDLGGNQMYAGMSKDAGYAQQVGVNLSASQFSTLNTTYVNQGYRLVDFDKSCAGGTVYYAGVWNKDGIGYAYSIDYTDAPTWQTNVNNYISQGFKPIMVDIYDHDWANAVENDIQPGGFCLWQNFPNPFNPSTTIQYDIPGRSFVTLKVYDLLGEEVATLANEEQHAGSYRLEWNAVNLPSGVYFYRLQAGDLVQSKKLILMK